MRRFFLLSGVILFILVAACVGRGPKRQDLPITVVYLANRNGEVDPCGCQVNQIGGMHRLQKFLQTLRDGSKIDFIGDAGDTFFAAAQLNPHRAEEAKLKAQLIARGYRQLGVDALTPGERDFAAGLPFLRELEATSGAEFLSANLTDPEGKLLFPPSHVFERHGARVGVVGISDPEAFAHVAEVKVAPPGPALEKALKKIEGENLDVLIVLSHSGLARDREIAKREGIDLVLGSHSLDVISEPSGHPWILQPLNEGQQVGVVKFLPGSTMKEHQLVNLGKEFDEENEIQRMILAHKEEVRKLAAGRPATPHTESREAFVAQPAECRTCHQKQYDFWAGTKHASAYLVLFAKNQHFDAECIGCHTLGFEDARGFKDIANPIVEKGKKRGFVEAIMKEVFKGDSRKPLDSREDPKRYEKLEKKYHANIRRREESGKLVKNYLGVQCEHCHGNRNGHPGADTLKKVQETSCKACHTPPHAKPYDPSTFTKVACPLSSAR